MPGAVGVPTIVGPANGQVIGVEGVTFQWTAVANATGYDLRVQNATTQAVLFTGSLTGNGSTTSLISLPNNGSYTFRVRACIGSFADASCGGFAARNFTVSLVAPSAAPTITFPAPGAADQQPADAAVDHRRRQPGAVRALLRGAPHGSATNATELQLRTFHPTAQTEAVLRSGNYRLLVRACQAGCGPYSAAVDFRVALGSIPAAAPIIGSATVNAGNSSERQLDARGRCRMVPGAGRAAAARRPRRRRAHGRGAAGDRRDQHHQPASAGRAGIRHRRGLQRRRLRTVQRRRLDQSCRSEPRGAERRCADRRLGRQRAEHHLRLEPHPRRQR